MSAPRGRLQVAGLAENTRFGDEAMWHSFLDDVDIVLQAALSPEEWERMKAKGHERTDF